MNRYLLDTHLIYWWMTDDARLGESTRSIISESDVVVSTASIWEMVLKNTKGKLTLPEECIATSLEAQGFLILSIYPRHIEALRGLNCEHADPFDRLLIAQAQEEKLTLMSRDAAILALELDGVMAG